MKGRDIGKILQGPGGYGLVILAGGIVAFMLWNKAKGAASAAAAAAGGIVSGNNPITQNTIDWGGAPETAYQGAGVAGTIGAATNTASGGALASIGNWIGGGLYSLFNGGYNPNAPTGGSSGASGSSGQVAVANSPTAATGSALPSNNADVFNWGLQGNGW